jgi:hypothetical protein
MRCFGKSNLMSITLILETSCCQSITTGYDGGLLLALALSKEEFPTPEISVTKPS